VNRVGSEGEKAVNVLNATDVFVKEARLMEGKFRELVACLRSASTILRWR